MKKFQFKYEKILQLRLDHENEVKNKLGKINQEILEHEKLIESLYLKEQDFQKAVEDQMLKGVSVGILKDNAHNKSYLKQKVIKTKEILERHVAERLKVQKQLIEANKERKAMEKLKEKEVRAYKELEELEEKQTIDQIVTYQSSKKRGEF